MQRELWHGKGAEELTRRNLGRHQAQAGAEGYEVREHRAVRIDTLQVVDSTRDVNGVQKRDADDKAQP